MSSLRKYFIWLIFIWVFFGCEEQKNNIKYPSGKDLSIKWRLITNNYLGKGNFISELTIINNSNIELDNKNWELFFNHTFCRKIIEDSIVSSIKIKHVNGDLYKIYPTENFSKISKGDSISFTYISSYAAIKYSDAPGGFYFVFKNTKDTAEIIESVSNYSILPYPTGDELKFSKNCLFEKSSGYADFLKNRELTLIPKSELPPFLPKPLQWKYGKDSLYVDSYFVIGYESGLEKEANYLKKELLKSVGLELTIKECTTPSSKMIYLQKESLKFSGSAEAYTLAVSKEGVSIIGASESGLYYGIQSLRALIPLTYYKRDKKIKLPLIEVKDSPQFDYRGLMIDVARNFQSKEDLLKLIEIISFYKMNTLNIHLSDDEGWRLEIPELPELTHVGARRGHSLKNDRLIPSYGCGPNGTESLANGFYKRSDYIEILKYAKDRHIEVISEIDFPGHARAAIMSMEHRYFKNIKSSPNEANRYLLNDINDSSIYSSVQMYNDNVICPCQEGIYNFLNTVVNSISLMYMEAEAPLNTIHIGGDEVPNGVWEKSPACKEFIKNNPTIVSINDLKKYFLTRTNKILASKGLRTGAYEDMIIHRFKDEQTGKDSLELRTQYLNDHMQLYSWNNVWGWGNEDFSYRLANAGFPVVLGHVTNLYFDLAYTIDPEEPGQYWGGLCDTRKVFEYTPFDIYNCAYSNWEGQPIHDGSLDQKIRLSEYGRKHIRGIQGLLFSETLKKSNMMEYYMYPKVLALAERAWSKTPEWSEEKSLTNRLKQLNSDWNVFANQIGQIELNRFDILFPNTNFRFPIPGGIIKNTMLYANTSFPGLIIKYTLDGTEPTIDSETYIKPVFTKNASKVKLAIFNSQGRKGQTIFLESETIETLSNR